MLSALSVAGAKVGREKARGPNQRPESCHVVISFCTITI
jgi:hypothetical protein